MIKEQCPLAAKERGKMQTDMEGKEVRIFMKSESFHVFVEQEEVAEKYKMSRKLLCT